MLATNNVMQQQMGPFHCCWGWWRLHSIMAACGLYLVKHL